MPELQVGAEVVPHGVHPSVHQQSDVASLIRFAAAIASSNRPFCWCAKIANVQNPATLRVGRLRPLGGDRGRVGESNPEHTFINSVLVPSVRAGVETGRNRPRQAIEHLQVAAPHETGLIAALARSTCVAVRI
jgi:hypothetical protein